MHIYIDGDACPVINLTTCLAQEHGIEVTVVANHNHIINNNYASVVYVDNRKDSADYYIANHLNNGDIVVTQDYGLAAMVLARRGKVITHNGIHITNKNIDNFLNNRYIKEQLRNKRYKYGSKIKKRTEENNVSFIKMLTKLLKKYLH